MEYPHTVMQNTFAIMITYIWSIVDFLL